MEIGTWARADGIVGIVSKVDTDGTVTIFNPGDRQVITAPGSAATPLPTGLIEARFSLQMQVPHGLGEDSLRRWLAVLIDPVLRANATASLREMGLDEGAFAEEVTVDVREVTES